MLIILTIIPFVDFMCLGYLSRILHEGSAAKTPPKVEKLTDTFLAGFKIAVIGLIWVIIIFIIGEILGMDVLGVLASIYLELTVAFSSASNFMHWVIDDLEFLILVYLIGLLALMSLVNMVKRDSLLKAFDIKAIIGKIQSIGWVKYFELVFTFIVVVVIGGFIVGLIMSFVNFRGGVGIIVDLGIMLVLMSFVYILPIIFFSKTFSSIYDKAPDMPSPPPPPPPTPLE